MRKLIGKLGEWSGAFAERYVPDPWIYAILLTAIAFAAAATLTPAGAWGSMEAWQKGLWDSKILLLIAQFSINLILCTSLARTPLVRQGLIRIASIPKSAPQAIWLIAFISILLSLVSWALCIIGGTLFAQEVCRQAARHRIRLHYPLAIAAGYIGMMTWGCGLTSSSALISSTPGHFLENVIGVVPLSGTLGSSANLVILIWLTILCPLLLSAMHPTSGSRIVAFTPPREPQEASEQTRRTTTFVDRLETSPFLLKVAALLPLLYVVNYYFIERRSFTIDSMNLLFLAGVMLLYKTPRQMLQELSEASRSVWSIVFQFPFYAGLMGIIQTTGLGELIAEWFAKWATPLTWPAIGVAFQGLLNLFIPSGGTQWIVSGEILVRTSHALGFSSQQAILIEIMGDQLTNMVQPMWALPALALSGLQARHIMGYTGVCMVVGYFVMVLGLTLLPA